MNKSSLILKYFQKADLLTTRKSDYCRSITSLFKWMADNDKISSDSTTQLFNIQSHHRARIIVKENAVLAGIEEISYLLAKLTKLSFTPLVKDGQRIKNGQTVAKIEGIGSEILGLERTVLNILQRMSGIATETNKLINLIASDSSRQDPLFIAATRKTPWMSLDKKAVAVGGGLTHRLSLADGILIKDNHLSLISPFYALEKILRERKGQMIEIEVQETTKIKPIIEVFQKYNTDCYLALMFDNLSPTPVQSIISDLTNSYDFPIIFEVSGGITKENIRQWTKTGADLISIGALTHSPRAVNFSLEF